MRHQDQLGFIEGMQGSFCIKKATNEGHHFKITGKCNVIIPRH